MKLKSLLLISIVILINACIPDENPVKPLDRGDLLRAEVYMGNLYSEQLYFSLDNNTVVKQNDIKDWDIAFACSQEDYHIILNFGKFMKVAELDDKNFDEIDKSVLSEFEESDWRYDNPDGNKDSTAIGIWFEYQDDNITSKEKVYIIDRGVDEKGKKMGHVKFQVNQFNDGAYTISFADLNELQTHTINIEKDSTFNFRYLTFNQNGVILDLEPQKHQWDIMFSKFTELLYTNEGEGVWYSVTGVYLNRTDVEVAVVDSLPFEDIDFSYASKLDYSSRRNVIGHEWKYYDFDSGSYLVNSKVVFIIKSSSGFYYKLHFTDFYDNSGNRGTPKFEYRKI